MSKYYRSIFSEYEHEFLRVVPFPVNKPLMNGKIQLQIKTSRGKTKLIEIEAAQFKAIEKIVCYGWTPVFNEEILK
jgi:hypothetical protein